MCKSTPHFLYHTPTLLNIFEKLGTFTPILLNIFDKIAVKKERWMQNERKLLIERPSYLKKLQDYTGSDIIRVITGVRRCGKSSILRMYRDWLETQYGDDSILYVNFDSPDFILDKSLHTMVEKLMLCSEKWSGQFARTE